MDCPYCGKEMRPGRLDSGGGAKWYDSADDENFLARGIRLSEPYKFAEGFFCPDCRQIILPVPEIEGMWEKVQRKAEAASEKIGAAQKQWEARRTQKKSETEKKKFGQKDPWEM